MSVRPFSIAFAIALLLVLLPLPAAALTYDFESPAAAPLAGQVVGVYVVDGVPLTIEAGSKVFDNPFLRGDQGSVLSIVPPDTRRGGLGVRSDIPAGTGDPHDPHLGVFEGLLFRFAPGFQPTAITVVRFTQGNGFGEFEVLRLFVNGAFFDDVPGVDAGAVRILLPPGTSTLLVTPIINSDEFPTSSDPTILIASIEGRSTAPPPRAVPFDVRPGGCPNPLNPKSRGVLPAAIPGTADLDVRSIDPASIRVAGVAPLRTALEDVATPFVPFTGKDDARDCTSAGRDGRLDLTLKLDTEAIVAALRAAVGPIERGDMLLVPLDRKSVV